MSLDIDTKMCFHCNEENIDMSAEVASLKLPLSDIEAKFIMERCGYINPEYWAKMFEEVTSHTVLTDISDLQQPQDTATVISDTDVKLEICPNCG